MMYLKLHLIFQGIKWINSSASGPTLWSLLAILKMMILKQFSYENILILTEFLVNDIQRILTDGKPLLF